MRHPSDTFSEATISRLQVRYKEHLQEFERKIKREQAALKEEICRERICPPNLPEGEEPLPFEPPSKEIIKEVVKEIKKAIDAIEKDEQKAHKIILVYDYRLMFVRLYIAEITRKQFLVLRIDYHFVNEIIKLRGLAQNLEKEGSTFVPFPLKLETPLTAEESKLLLGKALEKLAEKNGRKIEDIKEIGIIDFDTFLGGTHLDPESEKNFLTALLELSEEKILIIADPRNSYGRNVPSSLMEKVKILADLEEEATPFNTASYQAFDILRKIIGEATIIQSGREYP